MSETEFEQVLKTGAFELEGPSEPEQLPAQLIRPVHGRLLWLAGRQAARLLKT